MVYPFDSGKGQPGFYGGDVDAVVRRVYNPVVDLLLSGIQPFRDDDNDVAFFEVVVLHFRCFLLLHFLMRLASRRFCLWDLDLLERGGGQTTNPKSRGIVAQWKRR